MIESVHVTVEEIRLRGFRAFENARLVFSDVTYLVGRNGAGKSSILDAMDLLRESVSDSLENALERRGGLQKVIRSEPDGVENSSMGIAAVFRIVLPENQKTQAIYGFEVQGKKINGSPFIREYFISSKKNTFKREGDRFDGEQAVSPPAGNLVLPLIARSDSLKEMVLDAIRNIRPYELSPARMASAPEIGDRSTLARDGVNAGDVLKTVEGATDHRWIVDRLAAVTAGIHDVRAESLLGRRVLRFVQRLESGDLSFDARQVSQGTLRSLGVLLALKQKPTPSVVLVDEIENSVHPSALAVLLDAAAACSDSIRVVLTSHSPEVLSHPSVTGERVRVVEWRNGASRIFRLGPETQTSVNEIDTVGWMLRSNSLWTGPRPETFEGDLFADNGETE